MLHPPLCSTAVFSLGSRRRHNTNSSTLTLQLPPLHSRQTWDLVGIMSQQMQRSTSPWPCRARMHPSQSLVQDLPKVEKQAKWGGSPKRQDNKWDDVIQEAVTRGQEVPEITWAEPGVDAASKVPVWRS